MYGLHRIFGKCEFHTKKEVALKDELRNLAKGRSNYVILL